MVLLSGSDASCFGTFPNRKAKAMNRISTNAKAPIRRNGNNTGSRATNHEIGNHPMILATTKQTVSRMAAYAYRLSVLIFISVGIFSVQHVFCTYGLGADFGGYGCKLRLTDE